MPYKHSQETKDRMSALKRRYFDENPEKLPYRAYHSTKVSKAEQFFQDALIKRGISGWIYNYPHGRYSYDFAFPLLQIDVEIDGALHQTERVKEIDIRRDEYAKANKWRVLRIDAARVYTSVEDCIDELIAFINDDRIFGRLEAPLPKPKVRKYGTMSEYNAIRTAQKHDRVKELVQKVLDANIDYSKRGWSVKVANIVGIAPTKGGNWFAKYIGAVERI